MGGCRCSYKDCTVKTDGKSHLFHYPVLDKVRCHKWLTNSRKLEFLNLTVSQLKNRVVCQHHFRPECFMNFMHDKLTFDAVPTENGPFCTPTLCYSDNIGSQTYISPEDIDDEFYLNKGQVNFSKKYVDFLTNGDICDTNQISKHECVEEYNIKDKGKQFEDTKDHEFEIEIDIKKLQDSTDPYQIEIHSIQPFKENKSCVKKDPSNHGATKAKAKEIRIISEKKISEPFSISGDFHPISATNIVVPRSARQNVDSSQQKKLFNFIEKSTEKPEENVASVVVKNRDDPIQLEKTPESEKKLTPSKIKVASVSSNFKPVLAPERIASIREKRKFNKRVASEAGLSNMARKQCRKENNTQDVLNHTEIVLNQNQNILNHTEQTSYLSMYDFNRLEARLTKMEDLLTHKIDQNSQKIKDIKDAISSKPVKKTVASTQTPLKEEVGYKKYLFTEISKFLSSDVNNSIYEELFLHKYDDMNKDGERPRRRKRRF